MAIPEPQIVSNLMETTKLIKWKQNEITSNVCDTPAVGMLFFES